MKPFLLALFTVVLTGLLHSGDTAAEPAQASASVPSAELREQLLAARERAWRSFFQEDTSALEDILAPELIAIQENSVAWGERAGLISLAESMQDRGVELTRLEFPRTEIQVCDDTAFLYYTYIMEQRLGEQAAVHAGRGTEIFVRRDGRWVDVGWHLDNGPFVHRDGAWIRLGEPVPEPGT